MELNKITEKDWDNLTKQYQANYWFQQSSNIVLIANSYQRKPVFYACFDSTKFQFAFVLFINGKNASLPTHFFYSPFIINPNLNDFIFNKSLQFCLNELKKDLDVIEFKCAPSIVDIRGFTWSGFKHQIYYTLIKVLNDFEGNYSENIKRQLNKVKKEAQLSVQFKLPLQSIIDQQLNFMMDNGLSKNESNKVKLWLMAMDQNNQLINFQLINEEKTVGSAIVAIDQTTAYLISIEGGTKETGGQTFLYHEIFKELRQRGIQQFDLLGANLQGVAEYKSKLGASLKPYYILSFRKNRMLFDIKMFFKQKIKMFIKG